MRHRCEISKEYDNILETRNIFKKRLSAALKGEHNLKSCCIGRCFMHSRLVIFEALKLIGIYIYSEDFFLLRPKCTLQPYCSQQKKYRMKKNHFIIALENVDLYGLILSMRGNCCRLLVLFFEFELSSKYYRFYRQSVERFGPRSDPVFFRF